MLDSQNRRIDDLVERIRLQQEKLDKQNVRIRTLQSQVSRVHSLVGFILWKLGTIHSCFGGLPVVFRSSRSAWGPHPVAAATAAPRAPRTATQRSSATRHSVSKTPQRHKSPSLHTDLSGLKKIWRQNVANHLLGEDRKKLKSLTIKVSLIASPEMATGGLFWLTINSTRKVGFL